MQMAKRGSLNNRGKSSLDSRSAATLTLWYRKADGLSASRKYLGNYDSKLPPNLLVWPQTSRLKAPIARKSAIFGQTRSEQHYAWLGSFVSFYDILCTPNYAGPNTSNSVYEYS
jgi:hypothetical protein